MNSEPNWGEFFEDRERLYASFHLQYAQQHARRDLEAYEQLEAEIGNILKTAVWLTEQDASKDILNLAEALWAQSDFLHSRGFIQRGLPLLEQARQAACQLGDSRAEFTWLEALVRVHLSTGNLALAQPLHEEALVLAQKIDEPKLKAYTQLEMGRMHMELGRLEQAAVWLRQALQGYRQIQDYEGEINTLAALGNLLSLQGDFATAEAYLEQGLPLAQARQDRQSEVALRYALGYAAALAQDWPKAIIRFEAVTDMARTVGDRFFEVRGLLSLGEAQLGQGNAQQAVILLKEALVRQEISDDIMTKAFAHIYFAKACYALNDLDDALVQLKLIYPYLLTMHQNPFLATLAAEAAWIMANSYLKQGKICLARTALHDVLNLAPNHMTDIRESAEQLFNTIE
jgi:tetratricopeptide (TPR) repeat protein